MPHADVVNLVDKNPLDCRWRAVAYQPRSTADLELGSAKQLVNVVGSARPGARRAADRQNAHKGPSMTAKDAQSRPQRTTMLAAQQREHDQDIEQHKRELLSALVAEQVIDTLGRPDELLKVQVRPLWQGHFRVNVLVGVDAVSAKVAHSYFLMADADGNINESTPKITRRY